MSSTPHALLLIDLTIFFTSSSVTVLNLKVGGLQFVSLSAESTPVLEYTSKCHVSHEKLKEFNLSFGP